MATIDEEARTVVDGKDPEPLMPPIGEQESPGTGAGAADFWNRIMTAETGEGEVESYLSHPLNLTGTRWNARLIRGLTGLLGNLKLAVVDIALSGVEFWQDRNRAS